MGLTGSGGAAVILEKDPIGFGMGDRELRGVTPLAFHSDIPLFYISQVLRVHPRLFNRRLDKEISVTIHMYL